MATLTDAANLIKAVEATGATMPRSLTGVIEVNDALWAALRTYTKAGQDLIQAHRDGTLTADTAADLLDTAAAGSSVANAAGDIVRGMDTTLGAEFQTLLMGAGGDDLAEALRPQVEQARQGLMAALEWFTPESTAEQVISMRPEAAQAWQALPGHVRTLEGIWGIAGLWVRDFGLNNHRPCDDPRMRGIACFAGPDALKPLHELAYTAEERVPSRMGRWGSLIRAGIDLTLNSPAQARDVFDAYLDGLAAAEESTSAAAAKAAYDQYQLGARFGAQL